MFMNIETCLRSLRRVGTLSAILCLAQSLAFGAQVIPSSPSGSRSMSGRMAEDPGRRLVDQANEKQRKGDLQGALRDLGEVLRSDPRNFWAYLSRGMIWLQTEDYAKAIEDATQAIALNPNNPENWSPYNLRGMAHYLLKRYADAARDWQAARRFQLPREFLHINLYSRCDALRLAGDLPGAIADCTASIQLHPTPEAYDNRGLAYTQSGDLQLALPAPVSWEFPAVLKSARRLAPRNLEGHSCVS